ncbi:hypothetical protein SBD_4740 [Streptomyces bottropensis ATCC 25435]|uniref:Uncharacterized protein n=1 Tax=Streptomyces bottropensis ATCC 25435 TaxID=1054862 RepID=M3FJV5_9ACTN|nr:hypothetical protein SBD_4740 [Streptomyces bottropensis ATCC 25435]
MSRTRPFGLTSHRRHRRLGHRHDCTSSRCPKASWQGAPSTGGSPAPTNDGTRAGKRVGRRSLP